MTQMELFEWSPPPAAIVEPFPYWRRRPVLQDIATEFVERGFDAGNARMMRHGWQMVADLLKAGVSHEQIGRDINTFTAAARDVAMREIVKAGRCGDDPIQPPPQPRTPIRRVA